MLPWYLYLVGASPIVLGLVIWGLKTYLDFRKWKNPNALRVGIINASKRRRFHRVTHNGKNFTLGKYTYDVINDVQVWGFACWGLITVPELYYREGDRRPRNLMGAEEHPISAEKQREALESHVARDVIMAFAGQVISPAMMLIIVAGIVLGGVGLNWYLQKDTNEQIQAGLSAIYNNTLPPAQSTPGSIR